MSLGADYLDEKLEKAIHAASRKAVIVAAAGNESAATGESGFSDSTNIFPAGLPDVLGVMAYDSDRDLAWFSNWDYAPGTTVDYEIAAPGTDIYSTWTTGLKSSPEHPWQHRSQPEPAEHWCKNGERTENMSRQL